MNPETRWLTLALVIMGGLIVFLYSVDIARGQHEHHSAAGRFYKSWMMPDNPGMSCCNEKDCYATEARKIGNRWEAKRREDGQWLVVPEQKIERNRDNPDGLNHLCAPPPMYGDGVYCFILGGAT